MRHWFRNIYQAVVTVAEALWVSPAVLAAHLRSASEERSPSSTSIPSCRPKVYPRFRGFHRYDLTTCIACERCARDCPVGCIYIGKERVAGRKGFQVTSYTIDYGKCLFCAICTENCPVDCIFMGSSYDLSCYSRDGMHRRFLAASAGGGLGPGDAESDGGGQLEGHRPAGSRRSRLENPMRPSRLERSRPSARPLGALQKPRHALQ